MPSVKPQEMKSSAALFDENGIMMRGVTCIYAIKSSGGGCYIGSAVCAAKRWARHLNDLRKLKHYNKPLQNAFLKYGEDGLSFHVILICDRSNLLMYEQAAIDALNPQYNIMRIADRPTGVSRSEETRRRMSEAQRRREKPSEETRKKIGMASASRVKTESSKALASQKMIEYYRCPENLKASVDRNRASNAQRDVRDKISASLKGIKRTDETKAKMSAAQKGHIGHGKGIPRTQEVKDKIKATKRANRERRMNAEALSSI
mgnify:CR=1 FL=1